MLGVPTLPSAPLPSLLPSLVYRDISVDVLSRGVLTELACIDIRCRVPEGVRVCLESAFELCEQIRWTLLRLQRSIPGYARQSLTTLENHAPSKVIRPQSRRPLFSLRSGTVVFYVAEHHLKKGQYISTPSIRVQVLVILLVNVSGRWDRLVSSVTGPGWDQRTVCRSDRN